MKTTYNTLTEAVIAAINEIKNLGTISAHQVTTLIREHVAENSPLGEWEIIGCEARPNSQNIKYWINHDDVRRAINELYANNELDALGFTGRDYNGKYMEYSFDVGQTPVPTTSTTPPANPSMNVPVGSVPTVKFNQPVSTFLENKIKTYVNNQAGKVTMKQIQSALKIKGLTCENIYSILDGLDYSLSDGPNGPDYFSQYVVL